jgi:putative glutamine amidotransferase
MHGRSAGAAALRIVLHAMRPVIGITPDEGTTLPRSGRPAMPRYELKQAYADAVLAAGGLPLVLPYLEDEQAIGQLLGLLDGLVVTGGAFDIGPEEYGETATAGLGPVKPARTRFERRILERALAQQRPVLGVCGGMQLLNVVCGGTLVQDLATEVPGALPHEQAHDPQEPAHEVTIAPGSLLQRVCGSTSLPANTTHHQAVRRVGTGLTVSGRTADGVVEAIEATGGGFVLGVQWHPELLADPGNQAIYAALVRAATAAK